MAGFCEDSDKLSGFSKNRYRIFLDQLNNYQLLKKTMYSYYEVSYVLQPSTELLTYDVTIRIQTKTETLRHIIKTRLMDDSQLGSQLHK
jgi:hypothetical protein